MFRNTFRLQENIHALDVETGVWRKATIKKIEKSGMPNVVKIDVEYTDFTRPAKRDRVVEVNIVDKLWKVRKSFEKDQDLTRLRRRDSKTLRTYNPQGKILNETVYVERDGAVKCMEVALNDPFRSCLTLVAPRQPHDEHQRASWDDILALPTTNYSVLVEAPASNLLRTAKRARSPIKQSSTPLTIHVSHVHNSVPQPTVAPQLPQTPILLAPTSNVPAHVPETSTTPIAIAPCLNGVLAAGMKVTYAGVEYVCVSIIEKNANMQAFAVLQNISLQIDMTIPAVSVTLCQDQDGATPEVRRPLASPTTDAGIINYTFSILKQAICCIKKQNVTQFSKNIDVAEWKPAMGRVLRLQNKTESEFSVLTGTTQTLDMYLGNRWDIVADGSYIVARIKFGRKKMYSSTSLSPEKLTVQLCMVQQLVSPGDASYRDGVKDVLLDRYRLTSDEGLASANTSGSQE